MMAGIYLKKPDYPFKGITLVLSSEGDKIRLIPSPG
jgi:hypothetical protein